MPFHVERLKLLELRWSGRGGFNRGIAQIRCTVITGVICVRKDRFGIAVAIRESEVTRETGVDILWECDLDVVFAVAMQFGAGGLIFGKEFHECPSFSKSA